MVRDAGSVGDGVLPAHWIEGLRIVDNSIMPRLLASNTMTPRIVNSEIASIAIAGRLTRSFASLKAISRSC